MKYIVLSLIHIFGEIQSIIDRGVPAPKILVSDRAQIVMSYHILFDQYEEERLGGKSFGSTKSGIAPFYSDKYAKIGFQVSELFDDELLKEKVVRVCEQKNVILEHLYKKPALRPEDLYEELQSYKKTVSYTHLIYGFVSSERSWSLFPINRVPICTRVNR